MAVPTTIDDISSTASSNAPSGSSAIGVSLDDHLRAAYAIIKQQAIKGSDIASSSTIAIPNVGGYFVVTGTTTISSISDSFNGKIAILKFSGALTLTNSASLILFGSDITTAAGDILTVVNESVGVYRAIGYIDASNASSYATLAGTETLTNKTIVAANNTITTAGGLTATELDAALAELDGLITTNVSDIATNTAGIATNVTNIDLKAPIASPTFTGVPLADTAAVDTDTTQLATTAFVLAQIATLNDSVTARCNHDGELTLTNAPRSSYNIDTIERLSTGYYEGNIAAGVMDDALYNIGGAPARPSGDANNFAIMVVDKGFTQTTTKFRVRCFNSSGNAIDVAVLSIIITGGTT